MKEYTGPKCAVCGKPAHYVDKPPYSAAIWYCGTHRPKEYV